MPRDTKKTYPAKKANAGLLAAVNAESDGKTVNPSDISADWKLVDAQSVITFLYAITDAGGAVLLGIDSTGFGYTITVFASGSKASKWFRPDDSGREALYAWMDKMIEASLQ